MASEVRGLGIDAVLLEPGAVSSDGPAGAPSYVDPDGAYGPPAAEVAGLRREPITPEEVADAVEPSGSAPPRIPVGSSARALPGAA